MGSRAKQNWKMEDGFATLKDTTSSASGGCALGKVSLSCDNNPAPGMSSSARDIYLQIDGHTFRC